MTSVYLDTSALIKLYIEEEGTERIAGIVEEADDGRLVILYLTPIEARSAIRRREREGDIAATDAQRVLKQIEDDCSTFFLTQPLSPPVMEEAARLIDPTAYALSSGLINMLYVVGLALRARPKRERKAACRVFRRLKRKTNSSR